MEPKDELNLHQTTNDNSEVENNDSSLAQAEIVQSGSISRSSRNKRNKKNQQKSTYNEVIDWIKAILFAVVIVAVIRLFLFEPFIVDGESMEPNFHSQERVIVNLLVYKFSEPKFGDVIVLNVPEEGRRFIKRVIGVPGDKIRLEGDQLYINDVLVDQPFLAEAIAESAANGETYNGVGESFNFPNAMYQDNVVPEGMYFVLGDNRSNSKDSRAIGFVPEENIIGRTDVVMWPLDKFEFVKHYN